MEMDTGSAVSIISEKKYWALFCHLQLEKTRVKIHTYTGEDVKPERVIHTKANYKNYEVNLPLFVVKDSGPALFGQEWLSVINWPLMHLETKKQQSIEDVLKKHSVVFSDKLGTLKGIK